MKHQLSGNLQETSFAQVAGALFGEKRTGSLSVSSGERFRTVVFYEGNPVAVISADPRDHISRFLAAKGKITEEDAERLKDIEETKDALQSADFISRDVLTWGLKFRFVNLCYDMFRWTDGTFSFVDGPPPRDIFLMKVPTPVLLAKGVRYTAPDTITETVSGDMEVGAGKAGPEAIELLGEEEKALAEECRAGRAVAEIVDSGDVDPRRARETLYVLAALGFLTLRRPPPPPAGDVEASATPAPSPEEAPRPEAAADFEIERHAHEEEQAAAPSPSREAEPPLPLERHRLDDLSPPEEKEETRDTIEPPELEDQAPPDPGGEGGEPPPDLPPPPWQGEAADGAAAAGPLEEGAGGQSPFAVPEVAGPPEDTPREEEIPEPAVAARPEYRSPFPSRNLIVITFLSLAVLVGAVLWLGRDSSRSPSTSLPPIPPAEGTGEMAEGLPVPAVPKVKQAVTGKAAVEGEAVRAGEPAAAVPPDSSSPPVPEGRQPTAQAAPAGEASTYDTALAAFESGDTDGAAATWHRMIEESGAAFTVQVVVACQVETIRDSFRRFGAERKVFAVPLQLRERSCFRVCFGLFQTGDEARSALRALPPALQGDLSVKAVKNL